jgi:hypothetical protein
MSLMVFFALLLGLSITNNSPGMHDKHSHHHRHDSSSSGSPEKSSTKKEHHVGKKQRYPHDIETGHREKDDDESECDSDADKSDDESADFDPAALIIKLYERKAAAEERRHLAEEKRTAAQIKNARKKWRLSVASARRTRDVAPLVLDILKETDPDLAEQIESPIAQAKLGSSSRRDAKIQVKKVLRKNEDALDNVVTGLREDKLKKEKEQAEKDSTLRFWITVAAGIVVAIITAAGTAIGTLADCHASTNGTAT